MRQKKIQMLTIYEASELCGLSYWVVRGFIVSGQFTGYVKTGTKYLINADEFEKFLAGGTDCVKDDEEKDELILFVSNCLTMARENWNPIDVDRLRILFTSVTQGLSYKEVQNHMR